jgi:hypothetical protein
MKLKHCEPVMSKTRKRYALVSAQGTACSETVLTATEYADPRNRAQVEKQFCTGKPNDPLPGTWTDVSDNEACQ